MALQRDACTYVRTQSEQFEEHKSFRLYSSGGFSIISLLLHASCDKCGLFRSIPESYYRIFEVKHLHTM